MVDYYGKKVVVIGLGLTGLSCVNFFLKRGIVPCVMDTRVSPGNINKLPKHVKYYLGGLHDSVLFSSDLIVVSPGVSLAHPTLSAAANFGIEIIGDIELFCREVTVPIIAITGSNGKSTVTSLVGKMAKIAGYKVGIGGNIGYQSLMLLDSKYELFVLELSSFQLETTFNLKSIAATILNVTEDHMDRYPLGLHQYRAAKLRIYKNAKSCIINADDILTIPIYKEDQHYISFGVNADDYYLDCKYGNIWLSAYGERLLNIKQMIISGRHNYINALAALALADASGLPQDACLKALTTFSGLTHRFQLVLDRNNIRWINDSKSTNVNSTKAALSSLYIKGTLHLLLGGDSKSADFTSLKPLLTINPVRLYCFGQDGRKLVMLYPNIAEYTETLEQAMYVLISCVRPGDTALFSPACASFDQFKNFAHRGLVFTNLVRKLV